MEGQKPLKDLIAEKLDVKGFNLEKTFQATGIPKHYLEAIFKGEWHKLPPAPYTKGYFKKLESLLEFEPGSFWTIYQEEAEVKMSGAKDKLPENRFAIKTGNQKWLWPALAGLLIFVIYLSFNASRFLGVPKLNIANPPSATIITSLPTIAVSGEIDPRDKLLINREEVYVDKSGRFQEDYKLQTGLNTFEFMAKKFLGKETKIVKQIIYQPNEEISND